MVLPAWKNDVSIGRPKTKLKANQNKLIKCTSLLYSIKIPFSVQCTFVLGLCSLTTLLTASQPAHNSALAKYKYFISIQHTYATTKIITNSHTVGKVNAACQERCAQSARCLGQTRFQAYSYFTEADSLRIRQAEQRFNQVADVNCTLTKTLRRIAGPMGQLYFPGLQRKTCFLGTISEISTMM